MSAIFQQKPCILFETVELLYAFVNGLPPEDLTAEGVYCLTPQEALETMSSACQELDPKDFLLRQYFGRHAILDESNQFTCLASCMVYCFMNLDQSGISDQIDSMCRTWEQIRRRPFTIRAINWFTLDVEALPTGPVTSLAAEMKKLPVEEDFFLSLLETFSDYTYHMTRLQELIEPVAMRLEQLLEPFVTRAKPLWEAWSQFLEKTDLEDFSAQRTGIIPPRPFERAGICLRYFRPQYAPIQVDPERNTFWMHLGVRMIPDPQQVSGDGAPNERDLEALRLLGDKGRSEMVRALMGRSMSMQELATQLRINPGTVFRNLNSLTNTGLLTTETRGSRYYYRANYPYIQSLLRKMLAYYRTGGQTTSGQTGS